MFMICSIRNPVNKMLLPLDRTLGRDALALRLQIPIDVQERVTR
jgi:hypothetical protein